MNSLRAIFFVFLFYGTIEKNLAKDACLKLLHTLATAQQNYVWCSTTNAVPVKLCMGCEQPYINMEDAYKNLTANPNCSKEYFDHDRINVIQTTQNMLLDLWKKAYCNDCLNSNNSGIFEAKLYELNYCFLMHKKDEEKCAACIDPYTDLNNFYISLDQHNNGQVCFDLQDSMNQTRVYWSKQLKCCHREFRMTLFLITTICVGSLPILFYAGAYTLTRRRERYHRMLNTAEDIDGSNRIANTNAVQQDQRSTAENPQTSSTVLKKHLNKAVDESTDSEDENIPVMQKLT